METDKKPQEEGAARVSSFGRLRSLGLSRSDLIVILLSVAGIVVGAGLVYLALAPPSTPPYP